MFAELQKRLDLAKEAYQHVIDGIDKSLKASVSADPKHLKAAKALQAEYPVTPTALALSASEQPSDEPKTKKSGKK